MLTNRARVASLSTVVGALVAVVAGAFVVRSLARDWDDVREGLDGAHVSWVAVAAVLAVAAMTGIALVWRYVLRLLGADLGLGETLARYYLGELGKYVPGGVWPVVGRGELATRTGVARPVAYSSVALSLAALYLAGMFLALAALPAMVGDDEAGAAVWVFLLLPVGVLGLHHAVLERVRRAGERALRRTVDLPIPRWGASLSLLVMYVPTWLGIGGATWAIAKAMGQDVSLAAVVPAAVLSWVVGFVVVPVPGGLGIREAVFVAASGLAVGPAAAVAIVARVLFVVVDAGGALAGSVWLARRRGGPARSHGHRQGEPSTELSRCG